LFINTFSLYRKTDNEELPQLEINQLITKIIHRDKQGNKKYNVQNFRRYNYNRTKATS